MIESDILRQTLAALCKEFPSGLWIRRNVGAVKISNGSFVRFGLPGMADIQGILEGKAYEIECKTEKGVQSEAQKNWEKAVKKAGGIYIISRSSKQCVLDILSRQW